MQQRMTAILPCNDLNAAQRFFERLGFVLQPGSLPEYRMMADGRGGFVHLNRAVEGWLIAGRNPFGLYLYREDVDALAATFAGETIGPAEDKAWGMYEFALDGPDEALVRIGWPTRLRSPAAQAVHP